VGSYDDHDDIDALRGWVERLKALHRAIDEAELATLRARRPGAVWARAAAEAPPTPLGRCGAGGACGVGREYLHGLRMRRHLP
jgi:hypothetical protein